MTRTEYLNGGAHQTAKRGNDLPHARLNPELVRAIRANVRGMTARQWAEQLGMHVRSIEAVLSRRNWAHVA